MPQPRQKRPVLKCLDKVPARVPIRITCKSKGSIFQAIGPTIDKVQCSIVQVQAKEQLLHPKQYNELNSILNLADRPGHVVFLVD